MSKKNKEKVIELLTLLPTDIDNFKLLPKHKLVYAYILYCMEQPKAKENGSFYATNEQMIESISEFEEISKPTFLVACKNLENLNLISRETSNKRGVATVYSIPNRVKLGSNLGSNPTKQFYPNLTPNFTQNNEVKLGLNNIDNSLILNEINDKLNYIISKIDEFETCISNEFEVKPNFTPISIFISIFKSITSITSYNINNTSNIVNGNKVNSKIYKIKKYKLIKLYNILNKIKEKRKKSNFEINVNSKINNSKFEIKEVNHVGNEKKDMLLQSILNFKSSLENYKDNKPLAISIANGFYEKNKTSIEECNLNSVWDDVMNLINNIPTVEQNIPTLDDDEEDETYHYQDERSEFDKKLDAYARQVATGKLNFSTIM